MLQKTGTLRAQNTILVLIIGCRVATVSEIVVSGCSEHQSRVRYLIWSCTRGKGRIDQRFAEFGLGREMGVKMNGIGIHRQQGKPDIVRLGHGPAERMPVNIPPPQNLHRPARASLL